MDIAANRTARNVWSLADLLGRPLGRIVEEPDNRFILEPNERGRELLPDAKPGPHQSLDDALTEIRKYARGTCHLSNE
jgi:hypothetical protein